MSREDAPNFRPSTILDMVVHCWECDHADCINRCCYKYDFKFGKIGEERMTSLTCDSFKEI